MWYAAPTLCPNATVAFFLGFTLALGLASRPGRRVHHSL